MVSKDDRSTGGRSPSLIDLVGRPDPGTDQPIAAMSDAAPARGRLAVTGGDDDTPLPRLFLVVMAIITVGGLLLRLRSFNDSLFGDEISTYFIVSGNSLGRVLRLVESNQETSPPLYFILAWATKGLLSSQVQSIRLVSLVTGTAAIPLTFLLGMWTVGRRAALVGATCVALSPYLIFYSTEARPFMLLLFFTLLSTLALLRALDTGRPGWWVAYAVCTCGAVYTHYSAVFLLVVQVAWALWTQPQARRALVVANVAAGLGFIPWLNGLREDLHAPSFISALAPLNLHTVREILETTWIGHPLTGIGLLPGDLTVVLAGAGLVVGAFGLVLMTRKVSRSQWRVPPRTALIVLLAIAPAVLVLLYSWIRSDIFGGPFLIASWPGLGLAIGALVTSPPKPLRALAVVLTVGAFAIGGFKMLGSAAQRPNIDAAVAFIDRVGTSGDPIVSLPFSPNPLSAVDVALADAGQSRHHPVLRLGSPSLAEQLSHLSGPNPQPVFFGLPEAPPQEVARQAVALARHGTIFFISFGTSLVPNNANTVSGEFLKALPAGFRVVDRTTSLSFSGAYSQSVDVIRSTGAKG